MKIERGTRLGKYTVDSLIGSGGAGSVYRAIQEGPGGFHRPVAIKILHGPLNTTKFERLAREARIIGRLQQRNVVQVLELANTPDLYFLVMELIEGLTLRQFQDTRRRPLPLSLAIHLGVEVCRALQFAHGLVDDNGKPLGLVHRDIKPSNILISTQGDVKLSDFGIAKRAMVAADQYTSHGVVKGTPAYMSPEQRVGLPATAASDVFALCKILYEISIGRWLGEIDAAPSFGNLTGTMIGSGFDAVISQGLSEEPSERPSTEQLAIQLRALLPEVTPSERLSDLGEELGGCVREILGSKERRKEQPAVALSPVESKPVTVVDLMPSASKHEQTNPGMGPAADKGELGETMPPLETPAATGLDSVATDLDNEEESEKAKTVPYAPPTAETAVGDNLGLEGLGVGSHRWTIIALAVVATAVVGLLVGWLWPTEEPPPPVAAKSSKRPARRTQLPSSAKAPPVDSSPIEAHGVKDSGPARRPVARRPHPQRGRRQRLVRSALKRPAAKVSRTRPSRADSGPSVRSQRRGRLSVNTIPWSTVFVDGRRLGTTPQYRVSVPAGQRRLVLRSKDGRSIERRVTITAEKHNNLGLLQFDSR